MRLIKLLRLYRQASKLHKIMEEASMKKMWRSKTIWFQIFSVAAAVSGMLPIPADIAAAIVGVINVGLRFVTTEPVSVA
jgi:hypothetical protein